MPVSEINEHFNFYYLSLPHLSKVFPEKREEQTATNHEKTSEK